MVLLSTAIHYGVPHQAEEAVDDEGQDPCPNAHLPGPPGAGIVTMRSRQCTEFQSIHDCFVFGIILRIRLQTGSLLWALLRSGT